MTAAVDRSGSPGHPAPHAGLVPLAALWFGLFGAPAGWAAQLITNYALNAHFCYPGDTPRASPQFGGVRLVGLLVSAVVLVVSVAALVVAIRSWRTTRREAGRDRSPDHHETAEIGEGRTRFMAMAGILVSGIFLFGVLMNGLPLIAMPVCAY